MPHYRGNYAQHLGLNKLVDMCWVSFIHQELFKKTRYVSFQRGYLSMQSCILFVNMCHFASWKTWHSTKYFLFPNTWFHSGGKEFKIRLLIVFPLPSWSLRRKKPFSEVSLFSIFLTWNPIIPPRFSRQSLDSLLKTNLEHFSRHLLYFYEK